jgi:predicted nucleic acid-binding protein
MAGEVFVDTNVLVYSRDAAEPEKHRRARAWMAHLWATRRGRLDREMARREVRSFIPWRPVAIDPRVLEGAWHVQDRHRLSWWDSLIAAAAQAAGCAYLLSEDLQDDQLLDTVRVVNPFRATPDTLDER